jgi:hypothetical protein
MIGKDLPDDAFADLWSRLAGEFKGNMRVIFDLMNEPHDLSTEAWGKAAQAAVTAIRKTGAKNMIFVPGNGWDGAHSWTQNWYGTANSVELLKIEDPEDNLVYEVHQYFDNNHSGGQSDCDLSHNASSHFTEFTTWARKNKKKGWLGEYNFYENTKCYQHGEEALDYLDQNSDVWLGWNYWAGGPKWGCTAKRVLDPCPFPGGKDRDAMKYLLEHLPSKPTDPISLLQGGTTPTVANTQSRAIYMSNDRASVLSSMSLPGAPNGFVVSDLQGRIISNRSFTRQKMQVVVVHPRIGGR